MNQKIRIGVRSQKNVETIELIGPKSKKLVEFENILLKNKYRQFSDFLKPIWTEIREKKLKVWNTIKVILKAKPVTREKGRKVS